jgi:hypothetical protein
MLKKQISFYLISLMIFFVSSNIFSQQLSPQEKEWLAKAYRVEKNGWIFIHLEGKPFEIGFQRGYLSANEIDECLKTISYLNRFETARGLDFFKDAAITLFKDKISEEYIEEMKGIVAGIEKAGKKITFDEILLLNGIVDIIYYWYPQEKGKPEEHGPGCSAFIATGDATTDGRIVMAHNTWFKYIEAVFFNIILEIVPQKGHRILMQSWGPSIYSSSDFFITGAGLIGTETTIGQFSGFNPDGKPVFERARKAMQYANNIDQWVEIMIENNNGAYANSWLLGDIKTNEIACLELGLKNYSLDKKRNGYFVGSNVTENLKILREETKATYDDIRNRCVSRRVRLKQLMKKHYGNIDINIAKDILADHYDVYLEKENPSSRTICGHCDLDNGIVPGSKPAFHPSGAFDGKVVDSEFAKEWKFWAKWGSSCNIGFDARQFLERHPQYEWMEGYLKNLPAKPYTIFPLEAEK